MTWPAYPAYKSTDVEWVDRLPTGWRMLSVKRVIASVESGTSVNAADVPASPGEIGVLKTSCVYSGEFTPTENKTVYDPAEMARVTCPLRAETLIVSRMNTPDLVGAAAYVSIPAEDLFLPDRLWQVTFNGDADPRWVHHWTKTPSYRDQLKAICVGTSSSMQNISQADFGSLMLALPSRHEQAAIADFLDAETAKIDALIAKQEQLIATLREDRTATITEAVTKGLDPDVDMEDSGVEWLGAIPSHWTQSFLKYAANILTGFPFKSDGFTQENADIRLLRGANVGVDKIDWTDVVRWPRDETSAFVAYELHEGDIAMGLDRPFIGTGIRVSRIGPDDLPSLLLQRVARLRAVADFDQDYLFHLLTGPGIVHHLTPMFTGVSVPHVSPDQVGSFPIPQPPLAEQRQIVYYLADRCKKIDALVDKAHASMDVLREYRSALITDAVTGKIDVREAVA